MTERERIQLVHSASIGLSGHVHARVITLADDLNNDKRLPGFGAT